MIETFKDKGGFLKPIIGPIIGIAKAFTYIGEFCTTLIGIFVNILELIPNIFSPDKLINDIIYGITEGIKTMFSSLMGSVSPRPKKKNGGGEEQGLFGSEDQNKVVCIKPTVFNLIILIICPPFALLLKDGLKAWYLIIICALMTYYLYYIPGFIFAALHVLC